MNQNTRRRILGDLHAATLTPALGYNLKLSLSASAWISVYIAAVISKEPTHAAGESVCERERNTSNVSSREPRPWPRLSRGPR